MQLQVSSLLQWAKTTQKRIIETPLPELGFKTHRELEDGSGVCVCGKWFFVCLTWPVLRPGFRRWWPLFAVEYPQCLVEVDRETAASSPSPGRRRRAVVDHRVRWDPSSFWSGHPYFQRKLAVFSSLSRRIHKIASLLASSQSTFYGESYNTSILPYPATSGGRKKWDSF